MIPMVDSRKFSYALTERFGLEVKSSATRGSEGITISIQPADIDRRNSFHVELLLGWRKITAKFILGNFASSLMKSMYAATSEQKSVFAVFASSLASKGAKVELKLDGNPFKATTPEIWPAEWSSLSIEMRKLGVILEREKDYDLEAAFPWATGFFGMILSLLPIEEIKWDEFSGETEGASYHKRVKRYERSHINRAACLEIYGDSCQICEFNFGRHFGELGEGFIHIHHIVPLSKMGESYALDPGKDLIPVCPNCHAMLHRRNPVLLPEELRQLLRKREVNYENHLD